jgi:hypothetical protein
MNGSSWEFITGPKKQFVDDPKAEATGRLKASTTDPRFIQSNREYFRDLNMALYNFGTKGRMDGQTPTHQPRGVYGDFGPLQQELLDWQSNATRIVLGNVEAIREGIIDAVRQEIFATTPGPSLTTSIASEIAAAAVQEVLTGLGMSAGAAGVIVLVASIVKEIMVDSMVQEDMRAREQTFIRAMRHSTQLRQALEATLYNLNTLYSYYLTWLVIASRGNPSDFLQFRIPFTPESVSQQEVAELASTAIRDHSRSLLSQREAEIDLPALVAFLDAHGIAADTPALEQALRGGPGMGSIRKSWKFPNTRFEPAVPADLIYLDDRIVIYVIPAAARRGNVPSDVARRFALDQGIALLLEKAGAHALYNVSTKAWLSGREPARR